MQMKHFACVVGCTVNISLEHAVILQDDLRHMLMQNSKSMVQQQEAKFWCRSCKHVGPDSVVRWPQDTHGKSSYTATAMLVHALQNCMHTWRLLNNNTAYGGLQEQSAG